MSNNYTVIETLRNILDREDIPGSERIYYQTLFSMEMERIAPEINVVSLLDSLPSFDLPMNAIIWRIMRDPNSREAKIYSDNHAINMAYMEHEYSSE